MVCTNNNESKRIRGETKEMNYNPKDIKDTHVREQVLERAVKVVPMTSWMWKSLWEELVVMKVVNQLKLSNEFFEEC